MVDPIDWFRRKSKTQFALVKSAATPKRKRRKAATKPAPDALIHYPARNATVRVWVLCRARRDGAPHLMATNPRVVTCPACMVRMRADELQIPMFGITGGPNVPHLGGAR